MFFAASEAPPIVPPSKHSLIKFACLLITLNLTSKKPSLQFLKSSGWRILKRRLLGIKSRVSGFQLANYLFCILKTAAAAIATCLFFLVFVRSSFSGKTVGSGHFPTLEVPEQVNSMIEHFIKAYLKNLKGHVDAQLCPDLPQSTNLILLQRTAYVGWMTTETIGDVVSRIALLQ